MKLGTVQLFSFFLTNQNISANMFRNEKPVLIHQSWPFVFEVLVIRYIFTISQATMQ